MPKGIFGDKGTGMLRMIAYGSEHYMAYPPRPTDPKIAREPDWQLKLRNKSDLYVYARWHGRYGDRGGKQRAPKEEKSPKRLTC